MGASTIELVLLRSYGHQIEAHMEKFRRGLESHDVDLIIPEVKGAPTEQQYAAHEKFLTGCIRLTTALNPKPFRAGFLKLDGLHEFNFSGGPTLGQRLKWARDNALTAHHL